MDAPVNEGQFTFDTVVCVEKITLLTTHLTVCHSVLVGDQSRRVSSDAKSRNNGFMSRNSTKKI